MHFLSIPDHFQAKKKQFCFEPLNSIGGPGGGGYQDHSVSNTFIYVSSVRFMLQNIQKMQNRIDETFSETPAEMLNAKNASFLGCTSIFHRPHHQCIKKVYKREKKYNRFIFLNIICQFISCSLSLHYITKGLVVVH